MATSGLSPHDSGADELEVPATSLQRAWSTIAARTPSPSGAEEAQALPSASWNAAASVPASLARYAFAQDGESLYVISGFSNAAVVATMRRYDSSTNSWTSLSNVPVGTEGPVAAFLNGKIYLADGYGPASQNRLRIYDVATDTWAEGPVRPGVMDSYGAAIAAFENKIYVLGGSSHEPLGGLSIYDITANSWSTGAAPPMSFYFAGYVQVGHYLYLAGSFSRTPIANSAATMRFDLATNTWSTGPVFTPRRADFALAAAGTKLYAIGGDSNGGDFFNGSELVDELDISAWPAGSWMPSPDELPSPRQANSGSFFTTARSGGEIWSTGGFGIGGVYLSEHRFRTVPLAPPPPPMPLSAVSRRPHGAVGDLDIVLPLTGAAGVECRSGGAMRDFQIVLNFPQPVSVTGVPQAQVTSGSATIGSAGMSNGGAVTINASSVAVPLTNVANAQTVFVTIRGITDGAGIGNVTVAIRFLLGDANGDTTVNSADVVQARNRSGLSVTAASVRADLNADGVINSADVILARGASGTNILPAAPSRVVSRKTHGGAGAIDLDLPLTAPTAIECRSGGLTSDYEIVLEFPVPISVAGSPQARVSSGSATIGSGGTNNGGLVAVSGSRITVPLTNVANAQALSITLDQVTDGNGVGAITVPLRMLVGDTNADGIVNSADVTQMRNRSGQQVNSTTFRADVNVDGAINSADVLLARGNSGESLPPPAVLGAFSRKVHGDAGEKLIPLSLGGGGEIECRHGGLTSDYEVVVNFGANVSVTGAPQAVISSGVGLVGAAGLPNGGNVQVTGSSISIPLSKIADAATVAITLNGVTDGNSIGDITIPLRVLVGDSNGDGLVNSADAAQTRSRSGQPVDAVNFRSDVNSDGALNSADYGIVRAASGSSLP